MCQCDLQQEISDSAAYHVSFVERFANDGLLRLLTLSETCRITHCITLIANCIDLIVLKAFISCNR